MTMRDRLAATLINHWYLIDRALSIHRLQKVPTSKQRYQELDGLEKLPQKEYDVKVEKLIDEIGTYNSTAFAANITHLITGDKTVTDTGAQVACGRLKTSFQVVVTIPGAGTGSQVEAIRKALGGPVQDAALKAALSKLPTLAVGLESSSYTIKTACNSKVFKNLYDIESDFIAEWNSIKLMVSLHHKLLPMLSDRDKKEILESRAFINIKDLKLKDGVVTFDKFEVVETPEAKSAREIRERLEAALKRRIKPIKEIGVGENSVVYIFEDPEIPNFKVELDVVTHW